MMPVTHPRSCALILPAFLLLEIKHKWNGLGLGSTFSEKSTVMHHELRDQ